MKLGGILATYIFFVFFYTDLEAAKYCANLDDVCLLPEDSGPCRASFKRFFFDKKTGQCKEFIYGGCQGNRNNFFSLQDCQMKCPTTRPRCLLSKESGPCYGYFPMYYYNACSGKCERFVYGGCLGNENRFWTTYKCYDTCEGLEGEINCSKLDDVCLMPKEVGPCRAGFKRFFFDRKTGQCKQFLYGGCHGNKNNFFSLQDCQMKCPTTSLRCLLSMDYLAPECYLPKETGPCKGSFMRYFYNKSTGRCQRFVYGGCWGNGNNFRSFGECNSRCHLNGFPQPVVPLPTFCKTDSTLS